MTLSVFGRQSGNAPQSEDVWLCLATIAHPDLQSPIRLVANTEDIVSRGNTFVGLPFRVEFPEAHKDTDGRARLAVDNVDRVITQTLRALAAPPVVTLEVILSSTPDVVEITFADLVLRNIRITAAEVSGELSPENITIEPVAVTVTPQRFPGVF